ncbi:MAG: hypothetical protein RL885_07375 [Planctomycetota bacterium]
MSSSMLRWLIAVLAFVAILVIIAIQRDGPAALEGETPLFEETDLDAGVRTTVFRRASGREFEFRVELAGTGEATRPMVPCTGRVIAFLDRNEDGSYDAEADEAYAEHELKAGGDDRVDTMLHALFELPVVWRETETLSFEIELRDGAGDELASFSFKLPGSTR